MRSFRNELFPVRMSDNPPEKESDDTAPIPAAAPEAAANSQATPTEAASEHASHDPFDVEPATTQSESIPPEGTPSESTRSGTASRHIDWTVIAALGTFILCALLAPLHIHRAFGLPAHVLLLHAPVVLIPLLVIATVVVVWHPKWREQYGSVLLILALLSLFSTVLTAGAGEAFRNDMFRPVRGMFAGGPFRMGGVPNIVHRHQEAGEHLRLVMFIFTLALILVIAADRHRRRSTATGKPRFIHAPATGILSNVVVTLLAVVALAFVIHTGQLGARAVWEGRNGGNGIARAGGSGPGGGYGPGFGQGRFGGGQQTPFPGNRFGNPRVGPGGRNVPFGPGTRPLRPNAPDPNTQTPSTTTAPTSTTAAPAQPA